MPPVVQSDDRSFDRPLTFKAADAAIEDLKMSEIRSKDSYFQLSCHPNSTLTVAAAQDIVDSLKLEGFVPDVVIFDYADILAPPRIGKDIRDGINAIWRALRAMSQKLNCLVLTATQANAKAAEAWLLHRGHFSDDKRKYAEVTALFGIQSVASEKKEGISRYNWIVWREGAYDPTVCVYVAGCLAIGEPALVSCW